MCVLQLLLLLHSAATGRVAAVPCHLLSVLTVDLPSPGAKSLVLAADLQQQRSVLQIGQQAEPKVQVAEPKVQVAEEVQTFHAMMDPLLGESGDGRKLHGGGGYAMGGGGRQALWRWSGADWVLGLYVGWDCTVMDHLAKQVLKMEDWKYSQWLNGGQRD